MSLSWFMAARFAHIMYTFNLGEKANVLEAAVFLRDNAFW